MLGKFPENETEIGSHEMGRDLEILLEKKSAPNGADHCFTRQ